jgi:predicted GH43/DUF377 family glycosyl hydrolase
MTKGGLGSKRPKEPLRDDMLELRQRVEQIEGRNQILELVLKEYYVDEDIFEELQLARDEETKEDKKEREELFRMYNCLSEETLFEARDARDARNTRDATYATYATHATHAGDTIRNEISALCPFVQTL